MVTLHLGSWLIPLAITIAAVWFALEEDRRVSRRSFTRPGDAARAVVAYLSAIAVAIVAWYAWILFV